MQKEYSFVLTTVFAMDTFGWACVCCNESNPGIICYGMSLKDDELTGGLEHACFKCMLAIPEFEGLKTVTITPVMYNRLQDWFADASKSSLDDYYRPTYVQGHIRMRSLQTNLFKTIGRLDKSCYNCGKEKCH